MMLKNILICMAACLLFVLPAACKKKEAEPVKVIQPTLMVRTMPEEAVLLINGKMIPAGNKIQLTEGNYTVLAEAEGYIPAWKNITVKNGENKTETITLEQTKTTALLTSGESGVRVSLKKSDGSVEAGSTPLYVTNLTAGEYALTAEKPGFTTQQSSFKIDTKGMSVQHQIQLDNTIGYLELALTPADSVVFVNGKEVAYNGQRLPLSEGKHNIRVEKNGYATQNAEVEVKRKNTTMVEFNLREKPAKLSVVVKGHPDAVVKINGQEVNSPEKWQEVPAGEYKIQVNKPFYDEEEKTIVLKPEQEEQIVINDLKRNTGSVRLHLEHPGVTISLDGKKIGATQPDPNGGAKDFTVEGLAVGGKYKFTFEHPYQFASVTRNVTIKKDNKHVTLRVPFTIANSTIKYRNGSNRISGRVFVKEISDKELNVTIPTKSGKGAYSEVIKSEEVIVDYLPEVKIDPAYQTSFFDLLKSAGK